MIFLGIGILLGERGLGILTLGPHDRSLEVVGTLTLALVLFIDAVKLRLDEVGENWLLPTLTLGPGAVLTILLVTIFAYVVMDFSLVASLMTGTILASTDPVVLRDVLRDIRIPRSIRRTLGVEAGTNDIVILPTLLILIAIANSDVSGIVSWVDLLARLLLIGPLAGALVGAAGGWAVSQVARRYTIEQEHQALYGIGLVLASYLAGVAVGGDGFLAAYAGGITVTLLNFELCDCFIEYGEVNAEMAMFVAFIMFGAVISSMDYSISILHAVLFAVLVIAIARPVAIGLVLRRAAISGFARRTIGWFGPRGLGSMLLALLVVQSDYAGGIAIFAVVGIVVTISVAAHGATATPIAILYQKRVEQATLAEERESTVAGLLRGEADETAVPRISVSELAELLNGPNPPRVLDVRTRSQFLSDEGQIPGSIRVVPSEIAEWINTQENRERLIVAYCT